MEGCGPCNMSISEDSSTFCEPSADPPDPFGHSGLISPNDLSKYLNDALNIQDNQKAMCDFIPSTGKNDSICMVREDESDDFHGTKMGNPVSKDCFNKCAKFPFPIKVLSPAELVDLDKERGNGQSAEVIAQSGNANSANQPYLLSASLPTPLKLVSAMKGSREKLGNAPRKLSVTWAPDVYDPPPSSVSHVPSNKPQRHRRDLKKNGKNKQKTGGKSSRGSRGKDKKQAPKHGGSSSRSYKSPSDDSREIPSNESLASLADFDVASPDAFCGSSFLKKSVAKLHFPIAEAT